MWQSPIWPRTLESFGISSFKCSIIIANSSDGFSNWTCWFIFYRYQLRYGKGFLNQGAIDVFPFRFFKISLFTSWLVFSKAPYVVLILLLMQVSIFSSYPSYAEAAVYLALVPAFAELHKCESKGRPSLYWDRFQSLYYNSALLSQFFNVCLWLTPVIFRYPTQTCDIRLFLHNTSSYSGHVSFIYVTKRSAFRWRMWVVTGSGNANFYFAINFVYTVAQVTFLRLSLYETRYSSWAICCMLRYEMNWCWGVKKKELKI